jgi:hypothetical protein
MLSKRKSYPKLKIQATIHEYHLILPVQKLFIVQKIYSYTFHSLTFQPLHQYFSSALGQLIYICMSHLRHQGGNMDIQQQKELYVVDYDLPATNERRQFYRYLKKVLKTCHWGKSSNSVVLVDDLHTALSILELARAHNAHHANVYKCVLLAEHPIRQMQKIQCFHVPDEMYK